MTWHRAFRETALAGVLVAVVAFVAGNFVLVDARLFAWTFEARLAWVVVVPSALAFGAGVLYARVGHGDVAGVQPADRQDGAAGGQLDGRDARHDRVKPS